MSTDAGVTASAPGRWRIGDVTIVKVVEIEGASPPRFLFPDLTTERVQAQHWLRPCFADHEGRLIASIHCFVVESCGHRIVVDTCVGNDKSRAVAAWNQRNGSFLDDFARAGFDPARVDIVLCTHLHVDHVGWNTRLEAGRWVPTFRNARYLFGRTEWAHWSRTQGADEQWVMHDSVRPIIDAGLADLVDSDHRLTDEVRLVPTPGHTPGHVSVRIESRGQRAVITGDLMHHPIQCSEPDLAAAFDVDREAARTTRRGFLAEHADTPVLVLGTHFASPTAGRVVRDGDCWKFDA